MHLSRLEYAPGACVDYVVRFPSHNPATCIFCGVTKKEILRTTTANQIPLIIEKIGKALGRPLSSIDFYELSTFVGWVCRPGQYTYHRVIVERWGSQGQMVNVNWVAESCPQDVLCLFRGHIGGDGIPEPLPTIRGGPWNDYY